MKGSVLLHCMSQVVAHLRRDANPLFVRSWRKPP
jgi:hypothetical protein